MAADQVLVQGKVREETVQDQFDRFRLNQKQQDEMKKYKRTLMEPAKKSDVCSEVIIHICVLHYLV